MISEFSFKRKERVGKKSEYIEVYQNGCSFETKHFKLNILKNSRNIRRLGISVSKKTGNAVVRNHVKRIIREFFRLNKKLFPQNSDIVVTVKPGAVDQTYHSISKELNAVLSRDRCR